MKRRLYPYCLLTFFILRFFNTPMIANAQSLLPMPPEDAFLAGRLTSILEREFDWPCGSFELVVRDGIATVTLPEESEIRRSQIKRLPKIEGLQEVEILIDTSMSSAIKIEPEVCDAYSFMGLRKDTIPFPVGDLFLPLLADPKQPQFFISYRYYDTPLTNANAAAVGYGETFGFYRRSRALSSEGFQISISGALFAQFNLDTPSYDLVNADYIIGFPVTYRQGRTSMRFRVYHQSSHLGDEFLINNKPQRINLSFESFEWLVSRKWRRWRFYSGGEYFFSREPGELKPLGFHGGVEYQGLRNILHMGRWLGGLDLKSWEENEWSMDSSLVVGIEFDSAQSEQRRFRIMAEAYKGYAPHGQFYKDRISYYGIGMYLGF